MEIEIVSKKENELLDRTEVTFKASHPKEGTPQREAVREKLASMLKAAKERVIVDSMDSEFGKMETVGYAKVYKTKESAMKFEREYVLIRNKLKEKAKVEKKAAAQAPAKLRAEAAPAAPAAPAKEKSEKAPEKPAEKKA
ncbi:MAG: 30S ribosomal protein S24e [Thermoplasmatota archaeon]|nr:30S ribosomal protein S24e [Candidatus Thermoplasmatota archaeon]MBU1914868.1 30S ribosomal protein S24e [Candidatus Thermoplasmatota archaeon]